MHNVGSYWNHWQPDQTRPGPVRSWISSDVSADHIKALVCSPDHGVCVRIHFDVACRSSRVKHRLHAGVDR